MNLAGFEKIAPHLSSPLVLWSCFGMLFLGLLLKYGERKGRLPHLVFFLILLVMGAVIFLGREDKAVWIPAAITMLAVAAPAALAWKSSPVGPNTAVPFDAGRMAEQLYAQLDRKDAQLAEKNKQINALTEAIGALSKADAPAASINDALQELEQGNTKQAQAIFAEVLRTKEAEGRKANKEAAAAARHLGALAYMNDTKAALAAYQKAVQLDPDNADGWNYLGGLFPRIGEFTQAEDAFRKALLVGEIYQDNKAQANAYHGLGALYDVRGELEQAEDMFRKALSCYEELDSRENITVVYYYLGTVYQKIGNVEQAEYMYTKALGMSETLGLNEISASISINLGQLYMIHGDSKQAKTMFDQSMKSMWKLVQQGASQKAPSTDNPR